MSIDRGRGLWLIDAGYLFSSQATVEPRFQFDYRMLREWIEREGPLWRAYYLNSTPSPPSDQQDAFHSWLRSAPPTGPKIITKLYQLKSVSADRAYCEECQATVGVTCPHAQPGSLHRLTKQQQKGVDVGLATLALTHMVEYDTLVLSAGDGDLLDAVDYLCQRGKRFELVVFRAGVATDLQSRADRIHWINDFKSEVRRRPSDLPAQAR